jgi:uncharacterized protein (TIRG00374 family)
VGNLLNETSEEVQTLSNGNRSHLLTGLKISISFSLLAFLLSKQDLALIFSVVRSVSFSDVAVFFSAMTVISLLSAWKWQLLLRLWEIRLSYTSLLKVVLIGMFFNNLLPSGVGGDVSRLYISGRATGRVADTFASIFYDRAFALGAFLFIGIGALLFRGHFTGNLIYWIIFGCTLLAMIVVFRLASSPYSRKFLLWLSEKFRFVERFSLLGLIESFQLKTHQSHVLVEAFVIALVMQMVAVFAYYTVAVALHLHIAITDLSLFIPILYLSVFLPISINGIGIREVVSVLFFQQLGIPQAESIAFSLVYFILYIIYSGVGGLLFLVDNVAF